MNREKTAARAGAAADRGDATRQKLLLAAIDVFGRHGFDGATTRNLATAAGVNLQAIPYYFGGKEGLHIAAAEYIATRLSAHLQDVRERARAALAEREQQGKTVDTETARSLLCGTLEVMAMVFLGRESETWARFMIREQMEPTEAFRRIYGGVIRPALEVARKLVGIVLEEAPESEHVGARTMMLLGSVMVFRVAHAGVLAQLGWKQIGPREVEFVRGLVRELIACLAPVGASR